ncbi:MAG: hypothetical protein WCX73_05415 [Candidatus Pacearchaeota archaeon]|jgi:hypothetical protein
MARTKKRSAKHEEYKCDVHHHSCCSAYSGCGGAVYGLGFIGAAIYYISNATGFWVGVLGVLKAAVWPAFLVHSLLKFLGM